MRHWTRKTTRALLAGVLGTGAALTMGTAHAGKDNDTLTYALRGEVESLDSYFNTARQGIVFARSVWDQLLYRDPVTGDYLPSLAESYEWVDDLTIDMTLRQGITFHNGEAFNADDVVYTLNWVSDPENKVKSQRIVSWIKSVEKTGDFAVRIHLKDPFPAALEYLAGPLPIYPNEYYAEVGPEGMSRNPVGTGPYKVVSADMTTGTIEMVKNEDYFADSPRGQPSIGRLIQKTIPDADTLVAELMTGGIDWAWKVDKDQAQNLAQMPNLTVTGAETMRIGYLGMDAAGRSGEHPMTDVRVRQAVSHAINRQAIVDNLMGEGGRVVHSACFPEQFGCTQNVPRYDYNPEAAKALLAGAGYADGFTITLDGYRDRALAEAMVGDLAAVGIQAELQYGTYAAARDKIRAGDSAFYFMTWGSYSVNDVSAITSNFFKMGADDTFQDQAVRDLLEEGDTTTDPAARKAAYQAALEMIAEKAYWLPLWSYPYYYVYSADLNFTPTADEIPRFFTASWN